MHAELAAALRYGSDRFAQWRWKTLGQVTRQLTDMERAVRVALEGQTAADLGSRDVGAAATFLAAASDPQFWDRASALKHMIAPLMEFASWLRGCPCHEADRAAHRPVRCPWAGCRAPEFVSRVRRLADDITQARAACAGQTIPAQEAAQVYTRMLSGVSLKFEWAAEPPFSIWQARASDTHPVRP